MKTNLWHAVICLTLATTSWCHAVLRTDDSRVVVDLQQMLPEEWRTAFERKISEIKMLHTRVLRIQGFADFLEQVAVEKDLESESQLLLAHHVRNAFVNQVQTEVDTIVRQMHEGESGLSTDTQAELAALMTLAPSLRSFRLSTPAGLQRAIDDLRDLRTHFPSQLQLAVSTVTQLQGGSVAAQEKYFGTSAPESPATDKLSRRSKNMRNVMIAFFAAAGAVGLGGTMWLWHKSWQTSEEASDNRFVITMQSIPPVIYKGRCMGFELQEGKRLRANSGSRLKGDLAEVQSVMCGMYSAGDLSDDGTEFVIKQEVWKPVYDVLLQMLSIKPHCRADAYHVPICQPKRRVS